MSITPNPVVVVAGVSYAWPDGEVVFADLDGVFGAGHTGLVGDNGTGKSTLLRLIVGHLTPTAGAINASGDVGYLPQQIALCGEATVADLLGVRTRIDALRAIEAGDAHPRHFDALGDDWDVEARAHGVLTGIGLHRVGLDRRVGELSGGETALTALAGLRLLGAPVVLLDEPTNNLDRDARHRLYDTITAWRGALIVVSHDTTLLDLMDDTAELRAGSLTMFGGSYSAYREYLAQEQAAAQQALRTVQQTLKTEQRQRREASTKLARRSRYARTDYENKRRPKVIMNQRKTEAQVSAGKVRRELDDKVDAAQHAVLEKAERVRRESRIRIDLPDPDVPPRRRLAELRDIHGFSLSINGPQRVALIGPNGMGKTRLLNTLVDPDHAVGRELHAIPRTDRIGYLPQRLDHLNDDASILDNMREAASHRPPSDIRADLARFLFRADTVHRRVGDLSGGERFRVALAKLLLADPPNQLLVLDEPTNNLDLHSVDELLDALETYRGGLIVVSHDDGFLARINIDTWVTLGDSGLERGRS